MDENPNIFKLFDYYYTMDQAKIEKILDFDKEHYNTISKDTQRLIFNDINKYVKDFLNNRTSLNILFLIGLRGVGKTTILNTLRKQFDSVYTSGDYLFKNGLNLETSLEAVKKLNKKILLLDEIQYLNWQLDLKVFADLNPKILFVISGSSALNISQINIDLIRRSKLFVVDPLSFREYLKIKNNINFEYSKKIKEILFSESGLEQKYYDFMKIEPKITPEIKEEFKLFFKSSFPFMLKKTDYDRFVIREVVYKVIYQDIPKIESFNTENLDVIKKILNFIAICEKTSLTKISNETGIAKTNIIKFVDLLEKAKVINSIEPANPTKRLGDAKKYTLYTPNFRFALVDTEPDRVSGFAKEDLFVNIIKNLDLPIKYFYEEKQFDFIVRNQIFEIGSKNKKTNKENVIVIYSDGELKYNGKTLFMPFEMFALVL